MNRRFDPVPQVPFDLAQARWESEYAAQMSGGGEVRNRSGVAIAPLYVPGPSPDEGFQSALGFPGQPPYTRGIYATMHRGRAWTQRQLIGLGTPADYNLRLREVIAQGANAISLIPCNSVFRGFDMDEAHAELLGTCGTVVNCTPHMDEALGGVDLGETSCALNDPSPFTLLAFMLAAAKRRRIGWDRVAGTSNQSDYLSHFVANHMFFRIALAGSRRILVDHVEWCARHAPRWNAVSVVGQHVQQAGATPAQAMAFTLASAIQYAQDCVERGMEPDAFLSRFTFFFDISISFFEEIAKFRAGRRLWARITRERFGACDPRSWRFKFHGQTSGVDLTREQPLNNIARVAVQAMAGIFGGLQSLHTDSYDEALSCPTEQGARVAVNTQNVLREEAHLTDVIDPLGGSYYVEQLTDAMEAEIVRIMDLIENAGGMYCACEQGLVQKMIGESARRFQQQIESGDQTVVGVNRYRTHETGELPAAQPRPDPAAMDAHLRAFRSWKANRSEDAVRCALDGLAFAANDPAVNVFGAVVAAADAGCTHGEICSTLRRELGFGRPLVTV